jgi:hypothetical protein
MLTSDSCAGPGTQIGNAVNSTAPAAPCLLAQANFANAGVSLVAGTRYWVVVTTKSTAQQNGTTAVWWETNAAADYVNLDDGNGWQFSALGGPGAFQVQ